MVQSWVEQERVASAMSFVRHWAAVAALGFVAIFILDAITGSTGPSLLNFALIPPIVLVVFLAGMALESLARRAWSAFRD